MPGRSKEPSERHPSTKGPSTRSSLEPESQELSGMISTWIKDCQDSHSACRSSKFSGTLPTRVIDVGSPDGGTPLHLCDTNGQAGDFIALSHCWGGRQPLELTKENADPLKSCVPWAKLPNTFQDAIAVTRMLGLRYIWIDSLCIIQNDAQDWEREAAKMALIFESAYLTIAATAASNGRVCTFCLNLFHSLYCCPRRCEPELVPASPHVVTGTLRRASISDFLDYTLSSDPDFGAF